MTIKFGPAGLGPVKTAVETLEGYSKLGLKACEIAFTYGPYIKNEEDAKKIREAAERLGISLSIHGQYWINLNSEESEKVEKSKERILQCLEVGTWLGAKVVVFHPGFYGKIGKEETYENVKNAILDLQEKRKAKKFTPELAPETTGKVNVFGSIDETSRLVTDTKCSFCVDFAHILAREKDYCFDKVFEKFSDENGFHVHFSGIEYGEKGEKKHLVTPENDLKKVIDKLKTKKDVVMINESPDLVNDSVKALKIYEK